MYSPVRGTNLIGQKNKQTWSQFRESGRMSRFKDQLKRGAKCFLIPFPHIFGAILLLGNYCKLFSNSHSKVFIFLCLFRIHTALSHELSWHFGECLDIFSALSFVFCNIFHRILVIDCQCFFELFYLTFCVDFEVEFYV